LIEAQELTERPYAIKWPGIGGTIHIAPMASASVIASR